MKANPTDRYALRPTANGQYIDIVHASATKGVGALVRVPVRSGLEHVAEGLARRVCGLLNESAHVLLGEKL